MAQGPGRARKSDRLVGGLSKGRALCLLPCCRGRGGGGGAFLALFSLSNSVMWEMGEFCSLLHLARVWANLAFLPCGVSAALNHCLNFLCFNAFFAKTRHWATRLCFRVCILLAASVLL